MEKKKSLILIVVLWLVIIVAFVVIKEFTLQTGKEVLLKTVPVDPRDLFRGDYVILAYEISILDLDNISNNYRNFETGNRVYISLQQENGYGVPLAIYRNIPKHEEIFLKGRVKYVRDNKINIEYGIESYFVPEGKGRYIERARGKELSVKVSIDKFGNAAIKSLLIDGKKLVFE